MRAKAIITLLLVFSSLTYSQSGAGDKFRAGTESFTQGNYKNALELWLDLYKSGYRSAELNYNIGNAYFKLGDTPEAILFYERAYLLNPGDEDINYNLQIARTLTVDRFEEIPELFFIRWYNLLALSLTSNTWALISIATFIFCLVFLSVYFYTSHYRLKVIGFWLALLLLIVSMASLTMTLRNKKIIYDSQKAVIFSPAINGKSSPDSSGTDLFVLHEGTKVTVEDKVGDWYEIRLSDGNKGWVPSNSLEII